MKVLFGVIEVLAAFFRVIGDVLHFLTTGQLFFVLSDWILGFKHKALSYSLKHSSDKRLLREALAAASTDDKAVRISFQKFKPKTKKLTRTIDFIPSPNDFPPEMSRNSHVSDKDVSRTKYEAELKDFN